MPDSARAGILRSLRAANRDVAPSSLLDPTAAVIASAMEDFARRFLDFATVGGELHGSLSHVASLDEAADRLREIVGAIEPVAVGRTAWAQGLARALGVADAQDVPSGAVHTALLECRVLVGELGSVLVDLADLREPSAPFLASVQILIATPGRLADSLAGALVEAANLGSPHALLISGPSRTADVEKTLVCPAHGPRETHLVIVDETDRYQ